MPTTKRKEPSLDEIQDGVRGFSMVLREAIMDYYKGTCIQSFGSLSRYDIRRNGVPLPNDGTRRNFNYEREEHNRRNPVAYLLDDSKMFEVWREEHEVIFHPSVMRRSEYMSVAYDQLQDFFIKFLPSVKIIEKDSKNSKRHTDGSNDKRLIYRNLDQQVGEPEEEDDEDFLDEDWYSASQQIVRPVQRVTWDPRSPIFRNPFE